MPEAVSIAEMLDAEADAIRKGATEASLLETAGQNLGDCIHHIHPQPGTAIAYVGKGHNAGDALVALSQLRDSHGWSVGFRAAFPIAECAQLVQVHAMALGDGCELAHAPDPITSGYPLILIDGLLGTGSKGSPRPPMNVLIREMNELRSGAGAKVIAVDLPSGVDADTGMVADGAVIADLTLMIANAKAGLLRESCANHTGALGLVPLDLLQRSGSSGLELISPQTLDIGKLPRAHDSHKGTSGTVSLLVGSHAYPGAAVIAGMGALRAGAGLVFIYVPNSVLEIVRKLSPPEVITKGYDTLEKLAEDDADARVVGCGLGSLNRDEWKWLGQSLKGSDTPTVIDADALNAIASNNAMDLLNENHVITPHPGEFKRLCPELSEMAREEAALEFSNKHPSTLLLKGSRSLVAKSGELLRCNSTGHAGMASGGQGDLLAGVIGARLAYGESPYDAASLSAWLCGRAAELALVEHPPQSTESLTASDTAKWLGQAWLDWRRSSR